jgi:hypothetical protein
MHEPETVLISSNSSLSVDALRPVNSDKCSLVHNLNGSDAFICAPIVHPSDKCLKTVFLKKKPDNVNSSFSFDHVACGRGDISLR